MAIGTAIGLAGVLGGLFGKKKEGGKSDWLAKALVGVGGGLLKGIFSGKAKKQEREQRFKTYERLRTSRRPDKPYSRGVDPVVQKAISNIFASRGLADPYAGQVRQARQIGRVPGARLGGNTSLRRVKREEI